MKGIGIMRGKVVFVGAPYSANPVENIQKVKEFVQKLIAAGYIVHCPMLVADAVNSNQAVSQFTGRDWEIWTQQFLYMSDIAIFLRLDGFDQSSGVDNEIRICWDRDIEYDIIDDLEIPKCLH